MKKVVFVTRSMWAGGAERVIAQLVKYMVQNNIECNIVTLNDEVVLYDLPLGVNIHAIGKKSKRGFIDKFLKYKEVRSYLKHWKPDIVLALPEDVGIFVIPALIGTHIPVVVSERNNPWVMPWKKETRFARKVFYPFAAGFVFQTEQARSFFPQNIRKKGIVLPNPLDLERIPGPWKGERRKEIIGAGRLDKQKNFPLLIQAFSKFHESHPDYCLTIYGEGALREELERLAASLLPQGVYSFPGRTSDLLEHMRGAGMFVLSSDFEGMPNVLIEAMAMGMPVISTDCPSGGSADLIDHGKNGLLVPVRDTYALCRAMCRVSESEGLAEILGMNAKEIMNRLNASVVADHWRNYLDAASK